MAMTAIDMAQASLEKTSHGATLAPNDLDTLYLRLKLEGFNWREEHFFSIPEPIIWLTHPQRGSTWFRGWDMVEAHCNRNWTQTYWPKR